MIYVIRNSYNGLWTYRGDGKSVPNCLCEWAAGPKTFSTAWAALEYAKRNDVDISNKDDVWL